MTDPRVVLITGFSRGIGAGLAMGFARRGFGVVVNHCKSDAEAELWHECGLIRPQNNPQLDIERKLRVNPRFASLQHPPIRLGNHQLGNILVTTDVTIKHLIPQRMPGALTDTRSEPILESKTGGNTWRKHTV